MLAPILIAVPLPAKFTVVAVVLIKSNAALPEISEVVNVGLILKTAFAPVENPVSSVKLPARSADVLDESAVKLSDL